MRLKLNGGVSARYARDCRGEIFRRLCARNRELAAEDKAGHTFDARVFGGNRFLLDLGDIIGARGHSPRPIRSWSEIYKPLDTRVLEGFGHFLDVQGEDVAPVVFAARVFAVGAIVVFAALTGLTFGLSVEQYFKPQPPFFDADALTVRAVSDLLPPGATVYLTDRAEAQGVPMGLAAYMLREHPLYGNVKTGYGGLNNLQGAAVYDYALLARAYGGYGVVLVDKQGARLFSFHLGELREQEGVLGEEVRHVKRGGASSMPGQRGGIAGRTNHVEQTIENNMKDSADFAAHFFEENRVRRVLIGGTDENVAAFRTLLPKIWQSLVVGTFPVGMAASHTEVLSKALQVGLDAERQREKRLVENLITQAKKESGAVVGTEDTLDAINHGRVNMLVVEDGLRLPGYACDHCGALYTMLEPECEMCGQGKIEKTLDVTEMAVSAVLRTGGEVEVVLTSPGLHTAGGLGAYLRY